MQAASRVTVPQPTRDLNHLPGSSGLPLLGHLFDYFPAPDRFSQRQFARHGEVFHCRPIFMDVVYLLGPDANALIFQDREKNFSSLQGWDWVLGRLFPNGLMLRDFDDHRSHRKLMQTAFKKPAMQGYVDIMNPVIDVGVSDLDRPDTLVFYPAIRTLLLNIAASVFLGLKLGREADAVNKAFVDMVTASMAIVRAPVPGLSFWRGLRGRAFLERFFYDLLPSKRQSQSGDFFSVLAQARSEEGDVYSDRDVVDHVIFLLLAAFDTTSSALTTILYGLAKHPQYQQQVREELLAVGSETLGYDQLDRLPLTEWTMNEALRLYPPVPEIPRRALRAFEFKGYEIPANTNVCVSPLFTHRMPEYWTDPDTFDPYRFSPERAEHKGHPFQWTPFGGGAHKCIGLHFAYMQVKLFLHSFLSRYEIELAPNAREDYWVIPIPKPKDGLPLKLRCLNQ